MDVKGNIMTPEQAEALYGETVKVAAMRRMARRAGK